MAGHSKWKNIQHRKSIQDAKKGKIFTKVAKEIAIAAKYGGDSAMNIRLRTAILTAKAMNLPKDKIENAIKKGSGDLNNDDIAEIIYEGYGPGGVALLIETATDNRSRTIADIRYLLSKHGGSLAAIGSVVWMFVRKGIFIFNYDEYIEEQLLKVGIEAEVEDIVDQGNYWEVYTSSENFEAVYQAFETAGIFPKNAKISMQPKNTIVVDIDNGSKLLHLIEALNDHDDVQNVITNFNLPNEFIFKDIK